MTNTWVVNRWVPMTTVPFFNRINHTIESIGTIESIPSHFLRPLSYPILYKGFILTVFLQFFFDEPAYIGHDLAGIEQVHVGAGVEREEDRVAGFGAPFAQAVDDRQGVGLHEQEGRLAAHHEGVEGERLVFHDPAEGVQVAFAQ